MGLTLEPFRIDIPDATLADLHDRLERTRLPNQIDGMGWDQGTDRAVLEDLLRHWRDQYQWRKVEAELNGYEHVYVDDPFGNRLELMEPTAP